jgi:hypothetical protein
MVFQVAEWYVDIDFEVRAPIVLDNLIHRGEMPSTIVVFIEPSENRSAEYDAFSDAYATFLVNEIVPAIRAAYGITDYPTNELSPAVVEAATVQSRLLGSAPTASVECSALQEASSRCPGGNPHPSSSATCPRSPRIFLHADTRDLNRNKPQYNWLSGNLQGAGALVERGHDFRLFVGEGGHDGNYGGVILPDHLRWLWRPQSA